MEATKMNLKDIKNCPECGSDNIIYKIKEDEIVCRDCGAVFSELTPEMEKKFEKASDVI
jgi:transcription initiation factor TFIIIB Brf1 subunit/transcription initiation factor TFIIB